MGSASEYDVLVVGGGIHGVGVAQAAAVRGLRTLLLEQTGLASATSSRSSKLIHGGLRYLESARFALVRESLAERETLLRIAPELVKLTPFYIPVYPETRRRPHTLWLGLSLYALLGQLQRHARFRRLARDEWPGLAGLKQERLQSVFRYFDAQTDDMQLTRAVAASAEQYGARLACPASFKTARYENKAWTVHYETRAGMQQCRSHCLVNAGGPWVNEVLNNISPAATPRPVELVQGTHLHLAQPAPPGVFYVEAPRDGRAVFVMPWKGQTLAGTTENGYSGDPARVTALDSEITYLLETCAHYFPRADLTVVDHFAGLRVLPAGAGSAFKRPRDTVLHGEPALPGLLSIYGGKLTGYRATAEKVLTRLQPWLPPVNNGELADTRHIMLPHV